MVLLCTAGTWRKRAGSALLMQSQGYCQAQQKGMLAAGHWMPIPGGAACLLQSVGDGEA